MHLIVLSEIKIVQQPSVAYPNRNKTLVYSFTHEAEATNSWKDLTDKSKVVLPKNVYAKDENGKPVSLFGSNINIGGFNGIVPLLLRGDRITIRAGYRYFDRLGNEVSPMNTIFEGFISNVTSKKPIEFDCEDNMWKLKQVIAPNKVFPAKTYTLEKILEELLQGTGFKVRKGVSINMGDFRTQNETVCEVLARIKKDYHFESYFRGNELRCGYPIYVEQDAIDDGQKTFVFNRHITVGRKGNIQGGIISDELEYRRKDDINLSAIAYSVNKKDLETTTKDGHRKTKCERLEVLVNVRNGQYVSSVKPAGQRADFAPNTAGERRTLYFWNITDANQLIDLATQELKKYYYTGFRGKFTTFGMPFVRQGDNVDIYDLIMPERNGRYKVKSVQYTVGVNGFRQVIELDYLMQTL